MSFRNIYQDKTRDEEKLAKSAAEVKKIVDELQLPGSDTERQTRLENATQSYSEMRQLRYADSSSLQKAAELLKKLEQAFTENGYPLPDQAQNSSYLRYKSYNGRDGGWKLGI